MSAPLELTPQTFSPLSLAPLVDELLTSDEVQREGKSARTLVKSPALTVVLTVLRAGAQLLEHAAPGPVVVVPIRGDVTFDHGGERSRVSTEGSAVMFMGLGARHSVRAEVDSAFLLVIGARE